MITNKDEYIFVADVFEEFENILKLDSKIDELYDNSLLSYDEVTTYYDMYTGLDDLVHQLTMLQVPRNSSAILVRNPQWDIIAYREVDFMSVTYYL